MRGEDQEAPLFSPRYAPAPPRAPALPAAASVFDLGSSSSDAAWFCTRHKMRDSIHTNETKFCLHPSNGKRDELRLNGVRLRPRLAPRLRRRPPRSSTKALVPRTPRGFVPGTCCVIQYTQLRPIMSPSEQRYGTGPKHFSYAVRFCTRLAISRRSLHKL